MSVTYHELFAQNQEQPGVLHFGGARMAFLDIKDGFWGLRRHVAALVGRRLTEAVLQQAGANGGASFARSFAGQGAADQPQALRDCIAAYQAAGFGLFEIQSLRWPIGRVLVLGHNTFEAWTFQQRGQVADGPACAYTAGVLVGFVNALAGRNDIVCIERTCQAQGAELCAFELLPADETADGAIVAFDPDPFLSRQLNLLEILFDRMPMGVVILDRDLRVRRANPTWASFVGRYGGAPAERVIPGASFFDLAPGIESSVGPVFERVLAGETVRQEAFPLEINGVVSFWDAVLTPLLEEDRVTGILQVTIDVTEQVLAQQKLEQALQTLKEREERLSLVMRGTNDGIWDWDIQSNKVYYSPRWKAMLGYREEEIPNDYAAWYDLVHPEDREKARTAIQAHLKGRTPLFELEHRLRHKDGSYRWILTRGISVRDDGGNPTRMVGSHTDVTERKRTEAALQHQIAFENIITAISTNFINLAPDEIDAGIYRALQDIGEFTGVDRSYVFIFSGDRSEMSCTHEWCAEGIAPAMSRMQAVPVADFAWSNEPLMAGQVLHIPRVADLPPEASTEKKEFSSQGIQSLVTVPMVYRGEPVGFLGFDAVRAAKTWAPGDIKLLKIVGEIIVNALEHKRSQAIQAGQRQFLELLATGGDFRQTLHALVHLIEEQWPGMMGLVLLLDDDGRHLHIGASVSLPEEYVRSIEGLEIGPMVGSCGTASYRGERVIVEDIVADPRWDGLRDLAVKYGLGACWSEPVFSAEEEVVATFAMYYRHPRAPTEAELQTIEVAAHLVGIAVEHKQAQEALQSAYQTLEQRVQERTHELSTLLKVSHNVASTLELEPLLDLILKQLKAVVDYSGAAVMRLQADVLTVLAYRGPISQEQAMQLHFSLKNAPANREVIRRREPVFIADVRKDAPLARAFRETAGGEPGSIFDYVRSWMGVPLIVKEQVIGMLSLDHSEPDFYTSQHADLALAFANQVAVAVENARLFQAEQAQRRVAEGLRDILKVLNSDQPLDEILTYIVDQACRLLESDAGIIHHYDLAQRLSTPEAAIGMPPELLDLGPFPLTDTEPQVATFNREPFAVFDLPARFARIRGENPDLPPALQRWMTLVGEHFRANLAVPLVVKDQVYGALEIYRRELCRYSTEEIDLALTFGDQAAMAIENAHLRTQAEQAAVAAERNRLARDLHDAVSQTLFSASLIAEVLPRLWERKPEEGRRRLTELRELTRGALAEMRTLLLELRPAVLEEAELSELLRQLAESITGRARVKVDLAVEGECRLQPEVKVALYRIAQEALNNVAKHAGASRATIRLRCQPDRVELLIQDDGRGFDPSRVSPEHLGLGIMRERAEAAGMTLGLESQRGEGTRLVVVWERSASRFGADRPAAN